jgi:DNA-binding PadR family transcriptional regulator
LITGRWVERAGERRRRYYKLRAEGRKVLARERGVWKEFVLTVNGIVKATS